MRLILTFVPNWRCFKFSSEDSGGVATTPHSYFFWLFLLLKLMTVGGW